MSTNEEGKSMEFANAPKQSEAARISSLESEVRRLRSAHVLATSLATCSLLAAMAVIVSSAVSVIGDPSNAAFDQVTCRGLIVTDSTGAKRIIASSFPSGESAISWFDSGGKARLLAGTYPDGEASVGHIDASGKVRIMTGTYGDGRIGMSLLDQQDRPMIRAGIWPNGSMIYPTKDGK